MHTLLVNCERLFWMVLVDFQSSVTIEFDRGTNEADIAWRLIRTIFWNFVIIDILIGDVKLMIVAVLCLQCSVVISFYQKCACSGKLIEPILLEA